MSADLRRDTPRGSPRISVIMGVYNGERHLTAALGSILGQTFQDFEFIIVDDGSTDGSARILKELAKVDGRVRLLTNRMNRGLTTSLNQALSLARGEFVARQDADDVSAPGRLEAQLRFLDGHPEIGLLGTAYNVIDDDGRTALVCHPPVKDAAIRAQMVFHNAFCHTSVMMRRYILDEAGLAYDEKLPCSQDVELWVRLLKFTRAANLEVSLVSLRKHGQSVSATRSEEQQQIATAVALREIGRLAPRLALSADDVMKLRQWYSGTSVISGSDDLRLYGIFFVLLDALANQLQADRDVVDELRRERVRHLLSVCRLRDLVLGGAWGLLLRITRIAPRDVLGEALQRLRLAGG